MKIRLIIANSLPKKGKIEEMVGRALRDVSFNTGVPLKLSPIETFDAPPYDPPVPGALIPWTPIYWAIYHGHFEPATKLTNECFLYLIEPQYNSLHQAFLYGQSTGICITPPAMSYATCDTANNVTMQKSRYIIEHEILHLLGATHNDSKRNVMYPGCDMWVSKFNLRLPILKTTIREVKKCQGIK